MNEKIVEAFNKSGLSIYRLSKKSGIAYTNVYELIHKKKDINNRPVGMVTRIAVALDCPVEQLLNPIHFMDGSSGKAHGVSYSWKYDKEMILEIKDGKETKSIATGLQMCDTNNRVTYNGLADAYIQHHLKEKTIKQKMERITRHAGKLSTDA